MERSLFNMLAWLFWLWFAARTAFADASFITGQKFQIILQGTPDTSQMPLPPTDAPVWDIDLFDSDVSQIQALQAAGKTVICYFSAGTVEDWRDDARDFPAGDVGKVLPEWPNEKWIRVGSTKVREIMAKRIKLAADKGCDAIDPDNTDGYQNDNGLNLRNTDAIDYVRWMQQTAASYGMKIGLKNSLDILPALSPIIAFAVNEQCAQLNECALYNLFLASGKPVFHIEYPSPLNTTQAGGVYCTGPGTNGMSTVLKELTLTGLTIYCDRSQVNTPTRSGSGPGRPPRPSTTRHRPSSTSFQPPPPSSSSSTTSTPELSSTTTSSPEPPSTSSSTPSTTTRPRTTIRPSSSSRTSSSQRPTSSPGGGGCVSKHWDQCGGQDWKGCTVCEAPYRCQGVSPPWYYQCL